MTHPLASLQATLAAASRSAWDAVEADLRARPPVVHSPGARLLFMGFDPTLQRETETGRAIVIMHKDERFLVPLDGPQSHRVAHLRHLQTLFGWPVSREVAWNAVGEIVESRLCEPIAPTDPTREHDVRLREIYVPGQVLLVPAEKGRADEGWKDDLTPGLDDAMAELDRLQARPPIPADATPEALVRALPALLESHDWRAFAALCDDSLSATDKRMAFEQFRQAWEHAGGSLAFEGQEGDAASAGNGDVVRTRIKRSGVKPGEVLVRPLRWVKRSAGWRYVGGIL
ncbi:MAG: hypothetical protein U1F43_08760 [Myxococcota bacterium]